MSSTNGLRADTQFSVFLPNKPGRLAQIAQRLADGKINIVAMSIMDSTEHGVLRMVAGNAEHARTALRGLDLSTTETSVLCATMPNRPGALADVMERLARAHIDVNYAYCTTGAAGGKTVGIFKVANINKAMTTLSERKPKRKAAARPAPVGARTRR